MLGLFDLRPYTAPVLHRVIHSLIMAWPLYFSWNHLGVTYFGFLPEILRQVEYNDVATFLILIQYVGDLITLLTPKFIHIEK